MSVIMTMVLDGDGDAIERYAAENPDQIRGIRDHAVEHGLIAHRFYASDDGSRVLVLDEWPDRQSFESFYGEQESQIRPLFEAGGVTSEPPCDLKS